MATLDPKCVADDLETEYLAVANGVKKPAKIALEPLVRAVQALRDLAASSQHTAAVRTLETHGYTYTDGAELWRPPLGMQVPNTLNAVKRARDGWQDEAKILAGRLRLAELDNDLLRKHQANDVWYFQGDGEDHIESMGRHMVVVIHAGDLRALLAASPNAAVGDASRFRWLTEDHVDHKVRERCREILGRMGVMSYSASCAEIDRELDAATTTAHGGAQNEIARLP